MRPASDRSAPPSFLSGWRAALAVGCFLIVLAGLSLRLAQMLVIPGEPRQSLAQGRIGLADFQDVVYYPLQAVGDGVNPYDAALAPHDDGSLRYRQRYPVLNLFPLYSPLIFLLYFPLAGLDFLPSAVCYVILNVGLLLAFSHFCWRWADIQPNVERVFWLATLMIITQAGRANFLGGETSLPLAFASAIAAVAPRSNGGVLGLVLSSFKPTFGLPLGMLLLAAGQVRTVVLGWGIGFLIGMGGLLYIFSWHGDIARMPQILRENQHIAEADPDLSALTSAKRVDAAGAFERWLAGAGMGWSYLGNVLTLGVACFGLWRLPRDETRAEVRLMRYSLITLATVAGIYHLPYDALLLWCPLVALAFAPGEGWSGLSLRWRWTIVGLIFFPMINILGTDSFLRFFQKVLPDIERFPEIVRNVCWLLVCTLNGLCLFVATLLLSLAANSVARPNGRS